LAIRASVGGNGKGGDGGNDEEALFHCDHLATLGDHLIPPPINTPRWSDDMHLSEI
jgi:hypothetical protein